MATRFLKARLKVCREIWTETRRARPIKIVIGLYAAAVAVYLGALWSFPGLAEAKERIPNVRALLSIRSWVILALIALFFLAVDGAHRVKRKKLRQQAKAHRNEVARWRSQVAELGEQVGILLGKPKLTGFFQYVSISPYGVDSWHLSEDRKAELFRPGYQNPSGSQISIQLRIVNESPTPTTLHNFSLSARSGKYEGSARHAEEWLSDDEVVAALPASRAEEEKKFPNLVTKLGNYIATQGQGLEGNIVFRLPDFKSDTDEDGTSEIFLTLAVEDAWGQKHLIKGWGPRRRPLPTPLPKPKVW